MKEDKLSGLFKALPNEPLPGNFRSTLMQKIEAEAARMNRRAERRGLFAVILASCFILATGLGGLYYAGFPDLSILRTDWKELPFYCFIGAIALILLGIDHWARQKYLKRGNAKKGQRKEQYL